MQECPLYERPHLSKKVHKGGNSGRVYVPKTWIKKKVLIILLE